MRADVERWLEDYPRATMFVDRLYEIDRRPPRLKETNK